MSKTISDMTYNYINPETNMPTIVPASPYEKILNRMRAEVIAEETKRIFLNTIYTQLKSLRDEEPKYFQQAMLCLDLGLNPKDLRNDDLIALLLTSDAIDQTREEQKKNFHLLDKKIVDTFTEFKEDCSLHANIICQNEETKEKNKSMIYKLNVR